MKSPYPVHRLYLPLLLAISAALYLVTLRNGFVWDDHIYLVGNATYRSFDLQRMLFSLGNGVEYSPLTDLSFALDYLLWGDTPAGYHLTNLVIFSATVVLIYLFTRELPFAGEDEQQRRTAAFLTALLFAVHPLPSEMVNFISCRNGLLSSLAFFGGGMLFARFLAADPFSPRLLAGVGACYLAALLTKASGIIFPLALLLLAVYIPSKRSVRQRVAALLPLFAVAGGFFLFFREIAARGQILHEVKALPLSGTLAVALQIPLFYLRKMFMPTGLSAEYANDKFYEQLMSPEVIGAVAVLSALTVIAVTVRKRFPQAGFALMWLFIALLPFLNLFATNPMVADRYAYLATYAATFLCGSLLALVERHHQAVALMVVIALAAAMGSATYARNLDWRSDVTLWKANIITEPTNQKGFENLVAEAIIAGDTQTARQILAERSSKFRSAAYDYLEGIVHLQNNDQDAALKAFDAAVLKDPDHIRSLVNIGQIYEARGNYAKAKVYYQRTLDAKTQDVWRCREIARKGLASLAGR